ncbi:MAG: hypothetical protein ACM32O_14645 [Clostridia bacterium]
MAFSLINGLVSGLILAAFLALCDGLFGTTTFQVLIDVGYVPILSGLPSIVELAIHLLISIMVTVTLLLMYPRTPQRAMLKYALIWIGVFCLLYFPFSLLSQQPLTFTGFIVWAIGHALYTFYVIYQIERNR